MVTSSWRLQKRVSDGESNVKRVKSRANRDKESWPTSQKNDSSYKQFPDPPAPTHMWQSFNLRFIQNFRIWNLERWEENQNCTWSVESFNNKYEGTLTQASFLTKGFTDRTRQANITHEYLHGQLFIFRSPKSVNIINTGSRHEAVQTSLVPKMLPLRRPRSC